MEIEPNKLNGAAPTVTTYSPLVKADANRVRQIWPRVRLGCLAIKAMDKHGDAGNWTPEHIRTQIEMGFQGRSTCELWLIQSRKGQMEGFLVTIVGNCPYLNVPQSLIVWVAYTFGPHSSFGPAAHRRNMEILAQLEEHARSLGLKYVDGYSPSFKWVKWLDRFSGGKYRMAQIMFRREVWKV